MLTCYSAKVAVLLFVLIEVVCKVNGFGSRFSGTESKNDFSSASSFRLMMPLGATGNGENNGSVSPDTKQRKRDKVMAFLRRQGVIGARKDFTTAMGVDEGPAGKSGGTKNAKKTANAYKSCTETGIVDDMSESFPMTSSGTEWSGFTDRVMGGISMATLVREEVEGRTSNVMKGTVSLANNGGFIQMATSLSRDPSLSSVDASQFDGVELDILYKPDDDAADQEESFNVHLRNPACVRQFSSYRATFQIEPNKWHTVRLPWTAFSGNGPGCDVTPFSPKELRRIGILAIGKPMKVSLALSGVKFYCVI